MTETEKIIVSAYTGILMCDVDDVHHYIEQKMGRPIYTHELGLKWLQDAIHRAVKQDFLDVCRGKYDRKVEVNNL